MEKKKMKLIAMAALIGVLALSFIINLQKTLQKMTGRSKPQQTILPTKTQAQPIFAPAKAEAKRDVAAMSWGRDPFVLEEGFVSEAGKFSSLKLMGITSRGDGSQKAIINNVIVSSGSVIGKFKVMEIRQNTVVVSDGNETYELKIVR
jgi:hypothetical protein